MKKVVVKGFIKLGLLAVIAIVGAGTSAKAQSLESRLTANIPFDFTVSNKKLPAGEYWIGRATQKNGDAVVRISSVDGHANISRLTNPVLTSSPKRQAMLIFHRYGDEYFLFQIWPAGATDGRVLPKSRSEREVENKTNDAIGRVGLKAPNVETVTILVNVQ